MRFLIAILFAFCNNYIYAELPAKAICSVSPPVFESYIDLKKIERPLGTVNIRAILVICDHYATPENNSIAQQVRVDLGTVSQMLDILQKRNIANVEKTVLQGTNAKMTNILETLNNIKTGKDDIIFYYFSGHGLMKNDKTYMLTADEKDLARDQVVSIIGSKNARLKMLISDCCSNSVDDIPVAKSINRSAQKIEAGEFDPIYKDLFLGYEGTMHLNAATEGEKAYTDLIHGGFFTYHLFKEGLIKKPTNNWTEIFNNARIKTSQMFMSVDADTKAGLAKEGIVSQTAKAYSMPKPKGLGKNPVLPKTPNLTPKINIYNYSSYDLPIFLDNNKPGMEWDESNTKPMVIKAGTSITINQIQVKVGYEFDDRDYYFDLEVGDYFLALDELGSCEMFIKDEHINESNFSSVAITDFNTLLLGKWEWDDIEDEVLTTFSTDGFTDEYPEEADNNQGTWEVRKEETNEYEFYYLTLTYADDESSLVLDYLIDYDEEFPDEIHLTFVSAFRDEVEISYEEAEEFLAPSIVMYKVK